MSSSSVQLERIQQIEALIISSIDVAASCMDQLSGPSPDNIKGQSEEFLGKIKAAKALVQAALTDRSTLINKTFEASTYALRASVIAQDEKIRALKESIDHLKSNET